MIRLSCTELSFSSNIFYKFSDIFVVDKEKSGVSCKGKPKIILGIVRNYTSVRKGSAVYATTVVYWSTDPGQRSQLFVVWCKFNVDVVVVASVSSSFSVTKARYLAQYIDAWILRTETGRSETRKSDGCQGKLRCPRCKEITRRSCLRYTRKSRRSYESRWYPR